MPSRKKEKVPTYEDYTYLFFTIKYECRAWYGCINIEVYLADRLLFEHEYRSALDGLFPTQEMLNARIESVIFDKMSKLFNEEFAEKDHEHKFVAR